MLAVIRILFFLCLFQIIYSYTEYDSCKDTPYSDLCVKLGSKYYIIDGSSQVKDVTRNIKKAVVASSLEEIRSKIAEKFEKTSEEPTIHLDSDGTEIDDEDYFRTLDENTELIAVFPGEHWIDPTQYVTITGRRESNGDTTDAAAAAAETARIQQLVGQLKNNLCNVSVLSDQDLDSLSNMDPNSLVDITGKDFMDQLKDSGRPLCAKRTAQDRINLLKLLREGAIFCSERYPEEAEAIDMEISRQLNMDLTGTKGISTNTTLTTLTTSTTITTIAEEEQEQQQQQQQQQQTIAATTKTINEKNMESVKNALGNENLKIQITTAHHSNNNINNNNSNNNNNSGNSNNNDI